MGHNVNIDCKLYAEPKLMKGCYHMLATKPQIANTSDTAKLELYRLIGEGYKAMQDGRTSTIEEVREKLKKRREECV